MNRVTTAATLLLALGTAACDGNPIRPDSIAPEEVAGIYAVCALTFQPDNEILAEVDILAAGFETENPDVRLPEVQADANGDLQILFTPRGQFVQRTLIGRFTTTGNRVSVSFTGGTASAASYLLPSPLELAFQATPKSLTNAATAQYDVARADYARLANASESGLAERIPGRLMVVFQGSGVGCD